MPTRLPPLGEDGDGGDASLAANALGLLDVCGDPLPDAATFHSSAPPRLTKLDKQKSIREGIAKGLHRTFSLHERELTKETKPLEPKEEDTIFKTDWAVYQTMLVANYLEHKLLYQRTRDLLASERALHARPLRLADLGCGDADYLARTFRELSQQPATQPLLESFTGVDLSQPALSIGRENLSAALPSSTLLQLEQDDMLCWLEEQVMQRQHYDVIVVSFALHHLEQHAKLEVLSFARQLLGFSGGLMVLIDVFRNSTEDLAAYKIRYMEAMDATWDMFDEVSKERMKSHIRAFDQPESVATYQQLSQQAGFDSVSIVQEGERGFSKMLVFSARRPADGPADGPAEAGAA